MDDTVKDKRQQILIICFSISTQWWYKSIFVSPPKTQISKDSQYMSEERSIACNMRSVYTVARQVHDHIIWDPFKEVWCTCINWKEASKSSTGYILIRKNLTPMMRLMVLWTTDGLCSFCRSSFSSVMNFFFTAGNLTKKKQMRFYIKPCLHSSVKQIPNQHLHKKSSSTCRGTSRDSRRIRWQYSGSTPPKNIIPSS